MMPVNRYMDSHPPLQGNQMHFNQNYYPSFEAVPPVAKVDPSKPVVIDHPWPYPNNFGYSVPCYPYCRQGNFPGYYSYGPCLHFASPQFHCCGYHPPYTDAVPVHYVPPPHYLRELPRCEFDKPRDNDYHCCGCRNHTHDQRNGGSVRIEEQDPNVENNRDGFLVPFPLTNHPYPVFWIPPEYLKNEEHRKSLEADVAKEEKSEMASVDKKPPQILKFSERDPGVWSSWFPLDKRSLQSFMPSENGRSTADQKNEDSMRQFPFPIIWMPFHNRQGEAEKKDVEMHTAPMSVEEPASSGQLHAVRCPNNDDSMNKSQVTHKNSGSQVDLELKEKSSKQRSIPVKQVEEPKKKDNSEDVEQRGRDVSLKNKGDNGVGKATGSSTKRQSSSPPKTSKLPPVCLRVDPLPRKKNGNTTSRSPSPPGFKRQSKETAKDTPTASISLDSKSNNSQYLQAQESTSSSRMEAEGKKNEDKVIDVLQSKTGEDKDEEQRNAYQTQQFPVISSVDSEKEASSRLTVEKMGKHDENCIMKEDKGLRDAEKLATAKANDNGKSKEDKKELLEEEAAVRIQSVYRGFEVRKWEPLKKLKQIEEVREQVAEVRNKICGLESSPDLQKDERQRAVIGEMVMSLLLKLDTIQGLHPSLRDVRKSLARELVELQEKLDLLAKAKSSENHSIGLNNITGIDGEQNGDVAEHPNNDVCQMMDVGSDNQGTEASKPPLVFSEAQKKPESDVLPVFTKLEYHSEEPEDNGDGEFQSGKALIAENDASSEIEQTFQLQSEKSGSKEKAGVQIENIWCDRINEEKSEPFEVNESKHIDNIPHESRTEELAEEMADKEPAPSAEEQSQTNMIGVRQNKKGESNVSSDLISSVAVIDEMNLLEEIPEMNLLKELPIGVVDDAEPEKHAQAEIRDNEVSADGDVECEAFINALELQPQELHEGGQSTIDASSLDGGVHSIPGAEQQPKELVNEGPRETEATSPDKEVLIQSELRLAAVDEKQSVAEPNGWPEVASEKEDVGQEDGCPTIAEGDAQKTQVLSFDKDNEQMEESLPEEMQRVPTLLQAENLSQAEDAQIGEDQDNVAQLTARDRNEKIIQEEEDLRVVEMVSGSDKVANQYNGLETSDRELVVEVQVDPIKHDEEKGDLLPASSAVKGQEIEVESDRKLVEENEKMREMVEKLMEAGKEQLAVISNLTGRVKDLEKKLLRKKRNARRCRTTVSPPSRGMPSSKSPKKRAAGLVM